MNKDGIINNFKYQEVIRDGKVEQYLDRAKVNYLVMFHDTAIPEQGSIQLVVRSHLYGVTQAIDVPVEKIVLTTRLGERAPHRQVVVAAYP